MDSLATSPLRLCQVSLDWERIELRLFSTSCTNNESGQSFSTGESDHQSQRVVFSDLSKNRSGQVQGKYGQEENEDCATRFPNNKSACGTKLATDKSNVRQVISSDLEENRSGPILCTFEEENTVGFLLVGSAEKAMLRPQNRRLVKMMCLPFNAQE